MSLLHHQLKCVNLPELQLPLVFLLLVLPPDTSCPSLPPSHVARLALSVSGRLPGCRLFVHFEGGKLALFVLLFTGSAEM